MRSDHAPRRLRRRSLAKGPRLDRVERELLLSHSSAVPTTAPGTRYAKSGDVNTAYQVFGDGPVDLVYVPGWVSHVELAWELPDLAAGFERLGSFSRVILFDKRGTGMSDPAPADELPTLEQRIDDVGPVMDTGASEAPPPSNG